MRVFCDEEICGEVDIAASERLVGSLCSVAVGDAVAYKEDCPAGFELNFSIHKGLSERCLIIGMS